MSVPFAKRVELALKLKGIPFEYVEEDLKNKSSSLISYNPVYKKVPVLVHNGKPICESFVILEYIDETWKNGPKLLPEDPYKKSQVRFWASYLQEQTFETMLLVLKSEGEVQKKATKELVEKLTVLEEHLKNISKDCTSICSGNVGILDLVFFSLFGSFKGQEEVLGTKVLDPEKTPLLCSWIAALLDHPVVKETLPPREKMVGLLKNIRQNALKSSAA
ncbi:hypothetical protein TIFTF001_014838 [Ficus carica]|uniref:Glutathione S-transferase n=1 Tax=Ficus carica TaxID=3494 RepID=A0AA88A4N4_FICCA|nr:hypothetical protein TIFTF001_014838 [Ficus carica]